MSLVMYSDCPTAITAGVSMLFYMFILVRSLQWALVDREAGVKLRFVYNSQHTDFVQFSDADRITNRP